MEKPTNPAEIAARIEKLTNDQRSKLATVVQELKAQVHGNDGGWREIDWNSVIDAVIASTPELPPDTRYEAYDRILGAPGAFVQHQCLSTLDLGSDELAQQSLKLLPHMREPTMCEYLQNCGYFHLLALENELERLNAR